jgi:hypothetical protein
VGHKNAQPHCLGGGKFRKPSLLIVGVQLCLENRYCTISRFDGKETCLVGHKVAQTNSLGGGKFRRPSLLIVGMQLCLENRYCTISRFDGKQTVCKNKHVWWGT